MAVYVGLAATFLAGLKTGIGIIGHSPALLADGTNSTSDVGHGIVVSIFMKLSGKPPDEEYPTAMPRWSIAAVVVGCLSLPPPLPFFLEFR
ncbi:MAG: cation transporter [Desulfobacterales bacterium]